MPQASRPKTHRPPGVSTPVPAAHDTELLDEMDAFLDEVDALLESNILETVQQYVQKGGE